MIYLVDEYRLVCRLRCQCFFFFVHLMLRQSSASRTDGIQKDHHQHNYSKHRFTQSRWEIQTQCSGDIVCIMLRIFKFGYCQKGTFQYLPNSLNSRSKSGPGPSGYFGKEVSCLWLRAFMIHGFSQSWTIGGCNVHKCRRYPTSLAEDCKRFHRELSLP